MFGGLSWDEYREKYGESRAEHLGDGAGGDAAMVEQRRSESCARGVHPKSARGTFCWWCRRPLAQDDAA